MVFAFAALALLATTAWMVIDDYKKPWKRYQSEFRSRERQVLETQADEERQRINETELAQIREQIASEEQALAGRSAEIGALEEEIGDLEDKVYEADAEYRKTKALLDTAKYELDVALQHGGEQGAAGARADYEELAGELYEWQKTLEGYQGELAAREGELEVLHKGRVEAEKKLAALNAGLDSLEVRIANLGKGLDYLALNFPLMDFLEPTLKVEQVMLPGLFHDINFTEIDRVDRCVTCHVAANRVGFDGEEWEPPFRSHPRLDLFVGDTSPHPYATFGCTTCHQGLDRATDFARAGHSPSDPEEQARWEAEHGWKPQKYLETPILTAEYSEAGCLTCHADGAWTPASQHLDVGRQLISKFGCFGCHLIDYPAFRDLPRPGPSLNNVAAKTNQGWAYKWIEAPREFRKSTWMPHFFFQENIVGELNEERQRAEIAAIVRFLWDRSGRIDYPVAPAGDTERGQQLFESIGCTGCHLLDADATRDDFFPQVNRLHGPNLISTGSKVTSGWLFAWLKDPKAFNPDTRMPSLRLTDREAADITAYLMSTKDEAYEELEIPAVDGEVRDGLVLGYLRNTETLQQSQATLESMTELERDVYLGEQTVRKYGCYACHDIAGFEEAKPIGVELTSEGSKPVHLFDFGHVHDVPHTRYDWIRTKMLEPRIWDHGKETIKTYDELYKMPNFGMSEREAEAVVANVLGFTKASVVASRKAGYGDNVEAKAAGRNLITRYNCQGCHLIEGQGHAIRTSIEDVGMLPPNLSSQGARVQTPWLFDYLHDPSSETMRPWLEVRMPTFGFSDDEVNTLIRYFTSMDQREAFLSAKGAADPRDLAVGSVVFGMLQCARCHPAGESSTAGVSSAELAPSLLLATERLRHDWVPHWIQDPQRWIPGTKMPELFQKMGDGTFRSPLPMAIGSPQFAGQKREMMRHFESEQELLDYLGDVERVTRALRDHIWTLN
jgi:cytochrome c2